MEVSDYLKGGDILDFIDQCLEELENNSLKEKETEEETEKEEEEETDTETEKETDKETETEQTRKALDFKTIAKLACGMRRTNSEKLKSTSKFSEGKGGAAKSKSGVSRSKSLKSKVSSARQKLDSMSSGERSRLSSIGDDGVFHTNSRRSTLGDIADNVFN